MRPAVYRLLLRIGLWAQLAHVVGLVALILALRRALAFADDAIKGDIGPVTEALASFLPVVRITGPVGLVGFVLVLVAVMKGGQRGSLIYRWGLGISLFYAVTPFLLLILARTAVFPVGLLPGLVGIVHFISHRHEYIAKQQPPSLAAERTAPAEGA